MTFLNDDRKISSEFVLILLFLSFLAFRIYVNTGTLVMDYTENVFRVGVVPWSDAKAWADGAFQTINGEPISGVATARPLYSLFLAVLFFLSDSSYLGAIYGQMIVSALVLLAAYYLLKPIPDRVGVLLFMSFLAVWRPEVSTVFMTENLGIYILVLCFAMMWRGFSTGCEKATLSGIFLLGLSQAVRPWCVMTLITVPFFSFASSKPIKEKLRSFLLHVLFISLGFGLHPMAAGLFNKPGEGYANNPQTLYGQVVGGRGWMAVFKDPVIKKALEENLTSKEVNGIIYRRIKELFLENPGNFFKATVKGYRYYFKKIPDEFKDAPMKPWFFVLFLLILGFPDNRFRPHSLVQNLKHRPAACTAVGLGVVLFSLKFSWFWTAFLLAGFLHLVFNPKDRFNAFILLYLTGILLSIPFVGMDGGMRVKIGSDIVLFLVAAIGLARMIEKSGSTSPDAKAASDYPVTYRLRTYHLLSILLVTATLFFGMPYLINHVHDRPDSTEAALRNINAEDIAAQLNLAEIPIGPDRLNTLWHEWPKLALEEKNGRMAYFSIRYTVRDTVFFDKNEGINRMNPPIAARHWPLIPLSMKRTVMILETRYTLFPNVAPKDLERYENREVIVVGKLISKPRRFLYATPFVLYVSHIISIGESGSMEVKMM